MAGATYHDFEAYEAAIEDVDVRITIPRLAVPSWNINSCTIGGLHVQFGREGSGTIAEGSSIAGGQVVFVPISGGHRANGVVVSDRSVFLMQPRRDFTISVHEAHDWCSVFIPWHLTSADRGSGATVCYPAFAPDDRTSDRNPPYAIRFASKPEFDESINWAILGSAATFSFARSRASRESNTTHPNTMVSSSVAATRSVNEHVPSRFRSSPTYSK
jgi:hypothetical protein